MAQKTCLDVVSRALQMLKVLPAATQADADQAEDGMTALQGLISHMAETGSFGALTDVVLTADAEAGENERVSGAFAVTLPAIIYDECTGETRKPIDRCIVGIAADVVTVDALAVTGPQTWLYDATLAEWVALHDLELSGDCPLGSRFFEGLAAMLAMQVSDDYSAELSQRIVDSAQRGNVAIKRKDPRRTAPVAQALLRTSNRMMRGYR